MSAEYVVDADMMNNVVTAAGPSINLVVGTVLNATGHGAANNADSGDSSDSNDTGGSGGSGNSSPSVPQFQVIPMCTLTAGPTNGTYSAAQFAKWTMQWQNGMTNLNLNTMRTTICQATTPLSAKEVQFFTKWLSNPTIV